MAGLQGVILAGGISSRMGFPKALMPIGTSFFLLAIYQKLVAAGAKPVQIVINTGLRSSLEAQVNKFPDGSFVLNDKPAKGQIHSLKLALEAAASAGADAAMVALVDQPVIQDATLTTLIQRAAAAPTKIIVPQVGDKHGHPIIIPKDKFAAFTGAPEAKTARDIIHENAASVEYVTLTDMSVVADVDSPDDLLKLTNATPTDDMD